MTVLLCLCSTQVSAQEVPTGQYDALISGMDAYKEGDFKTALDEFQKAMTIFPDDPDIPFYIGLTYLQLNDPEKAITYFKTALEKNPEYLDAHFQLGVALIQQKAYKEAIKHLEKVYQKEPDRENLGYFLGFAYYQLGEYKRALDYLETAKATDKDIGTLTRFYIGLAKQQLGMVKEAKATLKEIITLEPTSPLATPSQRIIEMVELEERLRKRLNFWGDFKLYYDDNLILIPTTNVFDLHARRQESGGQLGYLRGEYFLFKKLNWESSVSYGLYQATNYNIKDNDVQDHMFSLDSLYRGHFGRFPYNLRFTYSFDNLLLDYTWFLRRHTARPVFTLVEGKNNLSLFQYTLQTKAFHEDPSYTQDRRDAVNHEWGIFHFIHLEGFKHYLKLGYLYDAEYAEGENWDYRGNKFSVGIQCTFPWGLKLNSDFEYKDYNYKHPNIFFDIRRADIERVVNVLVSKEFLKSFTVQIEYLRRRNTSNIALFDYAKNLYTWGITYRY